MYLSENDDVLDLVDRLRSQGISHYIDLPQIIVCGDQSSGKSSVLEAISGLQFPRKDNLCTRFATEVILRRSRVESTSASIVPSNDRKDDEKEKLAKFHRSDFQSENLESLVEEAKDAMGVDGNLRSFSNDVLRIELSGPKQPHLTLVDLPGLFSAGNKAQSESDAAAVKALVLSYMRNPRSIILAVVSAKNDFANQIVTKYTRDVDVEGERTLGVITKPDTLHAGSESERSYLVLAKNEDVYFRLGWHVLRNRDFDTRTASAEQRDQMERDFFAEGVWTELARGQVGVNALRPRLSHLLRQQILVELPSLIADVQAGLDECKSNLSHMGTARATAGARRLYLLRISQDFTFLMRSAIDGSYLDSFFGSAASREGYRKRLRAVIQNKSLDFAKTMRERGHAQHIVDVVTKNQRRMNPRLISKDEFIDKVLSLMTRSRGRELPGTYSPHIIGNLFSEQSEPWQALIHSFIIDVGDATQATLRLILDHVADSDTAANLRQKILQPAFDHLKDDLDEAVGLILEQTVKGHPITYNHYLTENIQKLRAERQTALLSRKLDQFFGTNTAQGRTYCEDKSFDVKSLLQTLAQSTLADMDRYACSEAIDVMKAYYKVALKTCIDDVAHAIERVLLCRLPQLLSAQTMMALDDGAIHSITAESDEAQHERDRITRKQESLSMAYLTLRALNQSQISGTSGHESWSPPAPDGNDSSLEDHDDRKHHEQDHEGSPPPPDPVSEPILESAPDPELDSGQVATGSDWELPIKSLGFVSTSSFGKTKKAKKKSKTMASEQQASEWATGLEQ